LFLPINSLRSLRPLRLNFSVVFPEKSVAGVPGILPGEHPMPPPPGD